MLKSNDELISDYLAAMRMRADSHEEPLRTELIALHNLLVTMRSTQSGCDPTRCGCNDS